MSVISTIIEFFQQGGLFMYPIALVLAIGLAICTERTIVLRTAQRRNHRFWQTLAEPLDARDHKRALELTESSDSTLARVLSYGLQRIPTASNREDIEAAMEEGLLEVLPRLERRTHYLALLANIATLLGLLGTIIGLIHAFTAVADADPASKAEQLSASISVAMNTTAFGLMVSIPLLLVHSFLQTRTTAIIDGLEMSAVRFLNGHEAWFADTRQDR